MSDAGEKKGPRLVIKTLRAQQQPSLLDALEPGLFDLPGEGLTTEDLAGRDTAASNNMLRDDHPADGLQASFPQPSVPDAIDETTREALPLTAQFPSAEQRTNPPDQEARDAALDIRHSWIVQAPAGAGKTELLTQRFLSLLAVVDEPEEILAITFTRAATAEMRGRILKALEGARTPIAPGEHGTLPLARAALQRSDERGWLLLEQPHRLDVQTIDSLCMRLAHGQPLLARLGGRLEPTEQAAPLYALAAERTLGELGSDGNQRANELNDALRHLLRLRDNNLGECQALIADMLAKRDQWQHLFPLGMAFGEQSELDWDEIRRSLEAPFAREVQHVLTSLHAILAAQPTLTDEILSLARYAFSNGSKAEIGLLDALPGLPRPHADFLGHWRCLRNFLLTKDGDWRKRVTKGEGFPSDSATLKKEQKERIARFMHAVERLSAADGLLELLCRLDSLPSARFDETEWRTLRSVFRVLRHAIAELHVAFAERNEVDFVELGLAAQLVLDDEESGRGLVESETKRHLLVDEFQDTSRRQHLLIGKLLREWTPGDGRTCFLVGDPMQSIYIFRQAEVELFRQVQRHGLVCGDRNHACRPLSLSENFRSHAGLVDPLNQYFTSIFTPGAANDPSHVEFNPSTAAAIAREGESIRVHTFFAERNDKDAAAQARQDEASSVVAVVQQHQPRMEQARLSGGGTYRVAILVRARTHLGQIVRALRAAEIPYRAVELERLSDRQEIIDLLSLTRALLHPSDRIAWLSVLRAPWCGLTLGDLHLLTGADDRAFSRLPVATLIAERAGLLSADGQARLARTWSVLERASADRLRHEHALSFAAWIERTWMALGGTACLTADSRANVEVLFSLLDDLAPSGAAVLDGELDRKLEQLCALPDASVSDAHGVQVMTIHKAKGLGFEVVLVPGLERLSGKDDRPLVAMLERFAPGAREGDAAQDEVLIAPLGGRGANSDQPTTYDWVLKQKKKREAGERKRLFYVACTRARHELHLFGTATLKQDGTPSTPANTLLASAWPALEGFFIEAAAAIRAKAAQAGASEMPLDGAGPGHLPATADVTEALMQMIKPVTTPGPVLVPSPPADAAGVVGSLAAASAITSKTGSSESMPALLLHRLRSDYRPAEPHNNVTVTRTYTPSRDRPVFERPEGSLEARARGNAVHAMLELVAAYFAAAPQAGDAEPLRDTLYRQARMVLRAAAIPAARVDALAASLSPAILRAAADSDGRWVLASQAGAESEASWSAWREGTLTTLRADRVFRAGDAPHSTGADCLWVIDYKTSEHTGELDIEGYLEAQKHQWRPQLEAYGKALTAIHGEQLALRYALYFPELLRLKSWKE